MDKVTYVDRDFLSHNNLLYGIYSSDDAAIDSFVRNNMIAAPEDNPNLVEIMFRLLEDEAFGPAENIGKLDIFIKEKYNRAIVLYDKNKFENHFIKIRFDISFMKARDIINPGNSKNAQKEYRKIAEFITNRVIENPYCQNEHLIRSLFTHFCYNTCVISCPSFITGEIHAEIRKIKCHFQIKTIRKIKGVCPYCKNEESVKKMVDAVAAPTENEDIVFECSVCDNSFVG